jgi:hypothetical protein
MGKDLTHGPLSWHMYHMIVSVMKNLDVHTAGIALPFQTQFRRKYV